MSKLLSPRDLVFITLHEHPQWEHTPLEAGQTFTSTLILFDTRHTATLTQQEFDTHRAAFVLLGLDDPVKWEAWVRSRFFASRTGS